MNRSLHLLQYMNEPVQWDVANTGREQYLVTLFVDKESFPLSDFKQLILQFRCHENNFSWPLWFTHPIYPMLEDIISQCGEVQDSLYTPLCGGKVLRECMRRNLLAFTFMIHFHIWVFIDWKSLTSTFLTY